MRSCKHYITSSCYHSRLTLTSPPVLPSLQPHSLSPTHSPTHSYTPHQHAHSNTHIQLTTQSLNQYIDLPIDWSINDVTKQAHPHIQTSGYPINHQLTPLTSTHTDSLPHSQIDPFTCQFTQSHIHTHSHSMYVWIKQWSCDSFT